MKNSSAFSVETPDDSPGFLLWQTTITWQRKIIKALEPFQISHAQFVILAILLWLEEQDVEPTQISIANMSKLDKMTVSKSLKKLSLELLIHRQESKQDPRANTVKLTASGRKLAVKLVAVVEKVDQNYFRVLGSSSQKSLNLMLIKLIEGSNKP